MKTTFDQLRDTQPQFFSAAAIAIPAATMQAMGELIAAIESENTASIRLHESLGFTVAGRFSEVGTKFGRWLDLTCMELKLG